MTYSVSLDPKSNSTVFIKLFKNVKNISNLRKEVLSGQLKCCVLKPSLILDPFQIVVAANKAVIAEKLTTKSIYTEVLFNLSISKNITQSLQKFGIDDKEEHVVVVIIKRNDDGDNVNEREIFEKVDGEEVDLKDLSAYSDIDLIKKTYKINDIEFKKVSMLDSVVSRIATKDILTI